MMGCENDDRQLPSAKASEAMATEEKPHLQQSKKVVTILLATRPKFLTASVAPVLVGSWLGYAIGGSFDTLLFVLALLAIMCLHAGANMTNYYFDHISQHDWVNKNPTPFSGGSRFIQDGILSPKSVLLAALVCLVAGSIIGVIIVLLTLSPLILAFGVVGLFGGFFYTAKPVQLGYRSAGESVIFLLFGLLPVYASYYIQTGTIDAVPLLPGCVVGMLIFLVILINEFPDAIADAAVNKRTLVVVFGVAASVWIHRVALAASFVLAAVMLIYREMFFAGVLYLLTLPIAVVAIKAANRTDLAKPGQYRASQITVLMHAVGSLALTIGFVISGLTRQAT
jgi:1,4-dihydroxy-2-naphthoate octaprenyltransferase